MSDENGQYVDAKIYRALMRKDEVIHDLQEQVETLKYWGSALREELASNKTDYDEYNRPELDRLVQNWDIVIGGLA